MDALVFNTLAAVAGEQDADKRQLLMDQSNEALGQHFMRHPGDMEEVAYDLLNGRLEGRDVRGHRAEGHRGEDGRPR